jgi:hypothetical protein
MPICDMMKMGNRKSSCDMLQLGLRIGEVKLVRLKRPPPGRLEGKGRFFTRSLGGGQRIIQDLMAEVRSGEAVPNPETLRDGVQDPWISTDQSNTGRDRPSRRPSKMDDEPLSLHDTNERTDEKRTTSTTAGSSATTSYCDELSTE